MIVKMLKRSANLLPVVRINISTFLFELDIHPSAALEIEVALVLVIWHRFRLQ